MPNYKVHDWSIHLTTPLVAYTIYSVTDIYTAIAFTSGYMAGGYLLSPDLDIPSRIYNRWWYFRWIWKPYQLIIPHRSILSHSGPFSATIRAFYISIPLVFLYIALLYAGIVPVIDFEYTFYIVWIWLGLCLSDVLHVLLDISPFFEEK